MSDRSEKLRTLEEKIQALSARNAKGYAPALRLRTQVTERAAEANRENQRRRRNRETIERRIAAGHLKQTSGFLLTVRPACAHCGETFVPKRTTARYCSTRCRVAAHRAQK
jgi:hypothetical protein